MADDLTSELSRLGLDNPSGYWENVFQEELGVTTLNGLERVGGDAYPVLVKYVNHAWEKKELQKLLKIDNEDGALTFKKQREREVEKLKHRYDEVQKIHKELKNIQSAKRYLDGRDSGVSQIESEIREALLISPSTWSSESESYSALIRQTQSLLDRVSTLLQQIGNVDERDVLNVASKGRALQGIFLNSTVKDQIAERAKLLKAPDRVQFSSPAHPETVLVQQFYTKQDEEIFLSSINKLGYSATVPSNKGGYWGVCIDTSLALDQTSNISVATSPNKAKQDISYFSTVKYVSVPLASFAFSSSDLKLSKDALLDLKNAEGILISNGIDSPEFQKACSTFFLKYGSHATKGPLHFGGSYTLKCSTRGFTRPELLTLKPLQNDAVNMKFGVSCIVGPSDGSSYSQVDLTRVKEKYAGRCSKTNQTFMEIQIQGGLPNYSTLPEWKAGLVASNHSWSLIDRGATLVSVWEIIQMNHSRQFEQVQLLTEALRKSWEKLVKYTPKPTCTSSEQAEKILHAVRSWKRMNTSQTQLQEQIQVLIEMKQGLIEMSADLTTWPMLYLSQSDIQQFLKSVVDNLSRSPSEDIKGLMAQLVERMDLNVLLLTKTVKFPHREISYISQWLYSQHSQPERTVLSMDKTAFMSFGRYLRQTLEIMKDTPTKQALTTSNKMEESQKSVVLSAAISRAFNLFRRVLQESGQKYEELFVLTLLFPFKYGVAYEPVLLNSFSQTDLQYLCEIFDNKYEQYFTNHLNRVKIQAFLFNLTVEIYISQSEIDVYVHQVIRHFHFLQDKIGKDIESRISETLNKFVSKSSVDWEELNFELSTMLGFSASGRGRSGHSIEKVLLTVAKKSAIKTEETKNTKPYTPSTKAGPVHSLFERLDLSRYYPQKLSLRDALHIRKEALESSKCTDPTKLYIFLLQRIMSYDYQCRVNLLSENKDTPQTSKHSKVSHKDTDESDGFDDTDSEAEDSDSFVIHPMDNLLALIHCSDDFLRQDLMSRLVDCQLSIPLILPDPFDKDIVTLCMWVMKTIVREWKSTLGGKVEIREAPLISYPAPIVTFIRFGKQERSKSKMMNNVISDSNHDHFFHHDCEGGNSERLLGEGLVEVCWYLPAGKQKDIFPDLIIFLNLHGNAVKHPKQVAFLKEASSIVFALITEDDLSDDTTEVLKKLSSAPGGVVLCTASKASKFKHLTEHIPKLTCLKLASKNADEVKKEVRDKIKKKVHLDKVSSGAAKSLVSCVDIATRCNISVDEKKDDIVQSQEKAQSLIDMLKKHDSRQESAKERMLPLQGRHLWQKWAAIDKEEHRQLNRGGMKIEEYGSRKQKDKYLIRKQQSKHVNQNLSPLMNSFIERLLTTSGNSRNYYLQYLKLYLNNHSRLTISSRKHEYKVKRSKLLEFQRSENPNKIAEQECRKQMEQLQQEIIDASLGLEHLLRELGQVYEALQSTLHLATTSEQSKQLYARLPMAGAELLIDGYPLELMDGDAAHVPKQWVTAVLQEVSKKLGNPRVFVLSVLGLQSTGKSTLINTTFGLQFNVGAGRCTRGAFMQLLSLSDELRYETQCDYILVVDTEGLRAPELDAQKTQKHDNELATFVIGIANETMINIYGETPGDMDDILQTSVHAFLRMKSVRLSPSCQFVHQNVGAVAASDKGGMGRSRFKDKLDKMTLEAAKEECDGQFQYFSDVIQFNEEVDVHHFPGLWRGDPPMAPVNPGYSEKALSLRSHVVSKLKPTSCKHLSDIQIQIQDLWKALLHEKFVFSFKNTLEISVYNSLEAKYVQWSWSFRSSMLEWEENAKNKIKNSQQGQITKLEAKLLKTDLPNTVSKIHEQLHSEMITFFEESEQREMLAQWQIETEKRLERLARELQQHAEGFCQELTSGHEALAKVKKMHIEYKEQLKKKVKDLISSVPKGQLKTGVLSESEQQQEEKKLEKMFDEEWEKWIKELKREAKVHKEEIDIEKVVQKSLVDSFIADEQTILKRLKGKHFKQWGKSLRLDLKEEHIFLKPKNTGILTKISKKAGEWFGREQPQPEPVLANSQHRECVEATTKYVFDRVQDYLTSRENENFNPTYTHELLDKLKEAIQERSRDHAHLTLTKEYTIDMSLTACAHAARQFQVMVDKFQKQNDPIEYLKREMKGPLYTMFKNQYFQTADEKAAASTFCDLLKGAIQESIKESLAAAVFQDLKGLPWVKTKAALKATILVSLGEALTDSASSSFGKLDDYFCYLTNANKSLEVWIKRYTDDHCNEKDEHGQTKLVCLAFEKADELVDAVWKTVCEVTKATNGGAGVDTKQWLKDMCKKLTGTLIVSGFEGFQDLGISRKLQDTQFFKNEVKKRLDHLQEELKTELQTMTMQKLTVKPYDLLYTQLCGCVVQCPFCKEQCDSTIKDHADSNVKHSVEEHRPQCLGGYRRTSTEDMVPDLCNSDIGSNKTFRCKDTDDKPHPYREFDKVYPNWSITVNMGAESSLYWKWLVGNYSEEIAKYYGAKDDEIPSEWKRITWEEAKQNVKDTYHI